MSKKSSFAKAPSSSTDKYQYRYTFPVKEEGKINLIQLGVTPQISTDEAYKTISEKKDVVFLDVRTPGEYSKGKIEGSINVPVDDVASQIATAVPDKSRVIYVYCLSGSRSTVAADVMIQLGYANVFSMTSGLLMWRSKKYPLVI